LTFGGETNASMKKPSKRTLVSLSVALALLVGWLIVNPIGRFGYSAYALTIYSGIPIPVTDLQLRSDGSWRRVGKSHDLKLESVQWLLDSSPEVLVIATGWDGVTRPDERIRAIQQCEVHIVRNDEAIDIYNRLRRGGRRVSIHYHSTC
jgi:hypothetical protein